MQFAFCNTLAWAAPTLARLSFCVPPARMAGFEAAYREKVVPLLKAHGLTESSVRSRATPDSIFSRLFEVENLSEVEWKREALARDLTLQEALRGAGAGLMATRFEMLAWLTFDAYTIPVGPGRVAPAGPGRVVPAGPGKGHWRTYDVTDGLPDVTITTILQDREGNLWFGTGGGVSRYDGQTFTNFTLRDGLPHNIVHSALEDREGRLWFGTGGGVSLYEAPNLRQAPSGEVGSPPSTLPQAQSREQGFTNFTNREGLASNAVRSVFQDREGNLYFGTEGGLNRYDGKKVTTFTARDGLASDDVQSVFQDRQGVLWVGTLSGASRYDGRSFATFSVREGLADNRVNAIFQDREGNLYFGTGGGVSRYDGKTWVTFTTRDRLIHDDVRAFFQDQEGDLWIGTAGGVSRYDGKSFSSFTTKDGLANNYVESILQDREGNLWFGTPGGASRYDTQSLITFTTGDGLGHDVVVSLFQDREGNLYFGTRDGGVSQYDGKTFTTFTTKDGLAHDNVRAILQDREGNLWFGTRREGASRYDGKTFTTFTPQEGLGGYQVWSILQDREGNLWFGNEYGRVSRYDGRTWTIFTAEDGLPPYTVWPMAQDREGNFWFGTTGGGASRYDGRVFTTFTTKDGLVSNDILSIFQDREGNLWFGTTGGVSRYDGKTFTTFTTKDGLAHTIVRSIFQDREGNLYFGTFGGGVSRYDGKVFVTLAAQDGLGHNMVASIFQDREGALWFGTEVGVTRYRPPRPFPPPVSIDAVVADQRYERASELSIPSTEGLIAFEFHAVSFKTRPEAMVYRYRLKGYDPDWKTTHTRRVEYPDLPRGTYTFEVQAVDRDLVYSETPATVALTVHLPYTQIGLVVALGVAGALLAWQAGRVVQRDRRLQQSNEDLRREMAERRRAEEERARLDAQLQSLRYLYRLRSALGAARSPEEVIQQAGDALMEVLSASISGGVLLQYKGRTWEFGKTDNFGFRISDFGMETLKHSNPQPAIHNPQSGGVRYDRGLFWGERERGRLALFCGVTLSEAQERALLDETAAQVVRALEARELEMQLLQSARLVSLGQMAAGVAHEINQPLGAISATAEDYYLRLKDGLSVSQGQWQEMLKRILGMVGRMTDTVEHLRVFSRDTSQEPGVRLSVNQVIHSALSVIGTQLKNHGIRLRLDLTEDLPPVMGHPYQIEQVFLNLLGNARDALDEKAGYRDPGTVDGKNQTSSQVGGDGTNHEPRTTNHEPRRWEKGVWVRTRCETFGGDRWVVAEVEDNGVGIDEAHVGRVFEPFFTTKPADRGTGLGLSISYAIVRNHGGQIACESRKGEGATLRVMLPVTEEESETADGKRQT